VWRANLAVCWSECRKCEGASVDDLQLHSLQIINGESSKWTVSLLGSLLVHEHVAGIGSTGWIDCGVAFLDVPNDAFFIDHKGGAIAKALLFVEDTISFDYGAFEIAEYWKSNPNLLCKFAVGGNAVYTHTKYLSVG
jgi:hypothetical protein